MEGELLVKFKEGPYSLKAANAHANIGATLLNTYEYIGGWQHIKLPEGMSEAQGIALYRAMPDCLCAQYNYTYHIFPLKKFLVRSKQMYLYLQNLESTSLRSPALESQFVHLREPLH